MNVDRADITVLSLSTKITITTTTLAKNNGYIDYA